MLILNYYFYRDIFIKFASSASAANIFSIIFHGSLIHSLGFTSNMSYPETVPDIEWETGSFLGFSKKECSNMVQMWPTIKRYIVGELKFLQNAEKWWALQLQPLYSVHIVRYCIGARRECMAKQMKNWQSSMNSWTDYYLGIYFTHSMMTSIVHEEMLRNRRRAIKETFKHVWLVLASKP